MASPNDDTSSAPIKGRRPFDAEAIQKQILSQTRSESAQDNRWTLAAAVEAAKDLIGNQRTTSTINAPRNSVGQKLSMQIPVPLPIESTSISSEKTLSKLLVDFNSYTTSFLQNITPLKDVAQELTLKTVGKNIKGLTTSLLKSFGADQNKDPFSGMESVFQAQSKSMLSRLKDVIRSTGTFGELLVGKVEAYTSPLIEIGKQQTEYARKTYDLYKKWFTHQMQMDVRDDSQDPNRSTGVTAFAKNLAMVLPGADTIAKAYKTATALAAFYGAVGGAVGGQLLGLLGRLGISVGMGAGGAIGGAVSAFIAPIIGFLGGFATLVGGLAVLLAAPILYSLWNSPEQLGQYVEAFAKIWNENIVPVFQFLYENIMKPIGTALASWWNSTGESAFLGIGDFVNQTLIYLLGTAIPAVLTTVGSLFKDAFNLIGSQLENVRQLFAGEINPLQFIGQNVTNLLTFIGSAMDHLVTGIINLFNLDSFFDMKEGETFVQRLQRFFSVDIFNMIDKELNDIYTSLSVMWDDAKTNFIKFLASENPIAQIILKVKDMIDAVIGIFPSIDDIKKFMLESIPSGTPDFLRNWLMDAIGQPASVPQVESPKMEGYRSEMAEMYKNAISQPTNQSVAPTVNVIAPTTNNNQSSTNVSGGGRRSGGIAETRPQPSPYDNKLYGMPLAY